MSQSSRDGSSLVFSSPDLAAGFSLAEEVSNCPPGVACVLIDMMQERHVQPGDKASDRCVDDGPVIACFGSRRQVAGNGLLPVPSVDALVASALGNHEKTRK